MSQGESTAKLLGIAALTATTSSIMTYAVLRWHQKGEAALREARSDALPLTPPRCSSKGCCEPHPAPPGTALAPRRDPFDPNPREGYLSWDDYFMAVAFLSAQRSKDPAKQVGACIVDQNKVICGIGYNGFPRGCADEELPWAKRSANGDPLATKYPYVCHAEMNAILNKNGASVVGTTVFVTMFPCNECAKLLIQAGVSEIVYHEDKAQPSGGTPAPATSSFKLSQQYAASKRLLRLAGVRVRQHLFRRPVTLTLSNHPTCPVTEENTTDAAAAATPLQESSPSAVWVEGPAAEAAAEAAAEPRAAASSSQGTPACSALDLDGFVTAMETGGGGLMGRVESAGSVSGPRIGVSGGVECEAAAELPNKVLRFDADA